jgi:hypothetical protein
MRKLLAAVAAGLLLALPAAASQPKWGTAPTVEQQGARIVLADRGDWFTQENERPNRTCVQWLRWTGGHWEVVGGGRAPMRTQPDEVLGCEKALELGIGPENAGRQLRALVAAGVESCEHDDGCWIEWGYLQGNDSGQEAYSNTVTVQAWQQPPPPPPPPPPAGPGALQIRSQFAATVREWERWQRGSTRETRLTIIRRIAEAKDPLWRELGPLLAAVLDELEQGE